MKTSLNEALVQLKLSDAYVPFNIEEVLMHTRLAKTNYLRSKVVSISENVIKNPENLDNHFQLSRSLSELDLLLTA
jgi:hypothetical protein